MSERLSDQELAKIATDVANGPLLIEGAPLERALMELIEHRATDQANADQARHWQRETERVKHELATCRDAHAALIGNYSDVMDEKNKLVVEVKERRANVLSDEDRLALEDARDFISDDWSVNYGGSKLQALAALDRLLSRGKDGR